MKKIFLLIATLLSFWHSSTAELYQDKGDYLKFIENKRHFSFSTDRDNNSFPDAWIREKGKDYQDYHSILIDKNKSDGSDGESLRFSFSGGRTGIYSGPLRLNTRYAYNIKLQHLEQNLKGSRGDRLIFGLRAYDNREKILKTYSQVIKNFSSKFEQSPTLRIEHLPAQTHSCVLFVHLVGKPSGRSFLWIDNVSITSGPRIKFSTGRKLNVFPVGEKISYKQSIQGTEVGKDYVLSSEIRDFQGALIKSTHQTFKGQLGSFDQAVTLPVPDDVSGIYYVISKLLQDGKVVVQSPDQIVARNSSWQSHSEDSSFGVILGRPTEPFDDLLTSLKLLGVSTSKLSLLPSSFSFNEFDAKNGFPDLSELLLKLAPDEGFKFIGVLDQIPREAFKHTSFEVNPANHTIDTFTQVTFEAEWKKFLKELLYLYANVISDWQIGQDDQPVTLDQVKSASGVIDFLHEKAKWMNVIIPAAWSGELPSQNHSLYISSDTTPEEIPALLSRVNKKDLYLSVELKSIKDASRVEIAEDLVKKVTILKASQLEGQPVVKKVFIDRLTDKQAGLMSEEHKPHSSYFAVKTMAEHFHGARYIGSLFLEDKDIVNYVFQVQDRAFVIIWRKSGNAPSDFYLGDDLALMNLMGNKKKLTLAKDQHVSIPLSSTPIFLLSPHADLLRTILSYQLVKKNLVSAVKLQKQVTTIENQFSERARFEFNVVYPKDWLIQENVFNGESDSLSSFDHEITLSPSALSFMGNVSIHTDLQISLSRSKKHHIVKIYREDYIQTDIQVGVQFSKTEGGLQMDVHLSLKPNSPKVSSFIASATFSESGESYEAYFKNVVPGKNHIESIFIRDGEKFLGKEVFLEVKENFGSRYLNKPFPVKVNF